MRSAKVIANVIKFIHGNKAPDGITFFPIVRTIPVFDPLIERLQADPVLTFTGTQVNEVFSKETIPALELVDVNKRKMRSDPGYPNLSDMVEALIDNDVVTVNAFNATITTLKTTYGVP